MNVDEIYEKVKLRRLEVTETIDVLATLSFRRFVQLKRAKIG